MSQHADDEQVTFGFSSSRNVTMQGQDESGYTWGEWRKMSKNERANALQDFLNELIDVYVEDDEL